MARASIVLLVLWGAVLTAISLPLTFDMFVPQLAPIYLSRWFALANLVALIGFIVLRITGRLPERRSPMITTRRPT